MSRKIIYLINPISGRKEKANLKEVIAQESSKRGIQFETLLTNAQGDYHFLRERIISKEITDVVVCGGDGSINAVCSALAGTNVNIGVIPMGSGNGLAFTASIPRQTQKALDVIFRGHSSYIDAFYINDQFSCMLCGIGFDAKVAHDFAKEKKRGLQTYIKVTAVNFFSAKPYSFTINCEGKSFSTKAFFISIANSNQFGNNFTIAPQASMSDGLLDIVVVKKMSKLVLPFSILRQVTGINATMSLRDSLPKSNILYFQTPQITITNTNLAPLHIDGDPKETSREFTIKLVRNAIRLIQPA